MNAKEGNENYQGVCPQNLLTVIGHTKIVIFASTLQKYCGKGSGVLPDLLLMFNKVRKR